MITGIKSRSYRHILWALFLVVTFALQSESADQRRLELQDYARIVTVSDPQVSPDGRFIVFVVSRPDLEQNRNHRQLVRIEVATGAQRILTHDRKGVSSPRFSPTGDRLAFVANASTGKGEKPQLFILPATGEAKKITDAPGGVHQYAWRPNGREIAYVSSDEPKNINDVEKHLDAFEVGNSEYLTTAAPVTSHLWLISTEGENGRRLTSGSWSVVAGVSAAPISWSADGKTLAFIRQATPYFGDLDQRTVQLLDVNTGQMRKVTRRDKFVSFGIFSPDGSSLAYGYPRDGDPNNLTEFYVARVSGGEGTNVTGALNRNLVRVAWMPGDGSLLVGGHDGTKTSLWLQPLSGPATKLRLGDVNPYWNYWVDVNVGPNGEIVFPGSTPERPSELYYLKAPTDLPKRLTDFNSQFTSVALGKVERFEWQGPDGFNEDGILVYPPDFNRNRKYALVLSIHGGPQSASTNAFNFHSQLMAANGLVVFQPNYRGSDNLGNAYQRAIWNDAGDGPGRDVMSGVEAVKKLGFVDESRIGVSGWSYGGYMTVWLTAHYNIWKTAMAGAPITNLFDNYSLTDGNVLGRYSFKGSPFVGDNLKDYWDQSPITYATRIKTPMLILHNTGDARVTITDSYLLFHALKDNGTEVKFVAYPISSHFPSDPAHVMDVYRRWTEWMVQGLK
jgi:dipeptidyl aminopeptidase/acylaminoacyl peptidase